MAGATIGLHDHALRPPEEIDLVPADAGVHGRPTEPVDGAQLEEQVLELAARQGDIGILPPEDRGERTDASLRRVCGNHGPHRRKVEEPERLGPLDRPLERALP